MRKILILIFFKLLLFSNLFAQAYKIEGEVVGLQDTEVILAYYFGGKQYAKDTTESKNGKFIFTGKERLDGGMYLIVLPEQKWFDIIISEQKFKFKTSLNNLVDDMHQDELNRIREKFTPLVKICKEEMEMVIQIKKQLCMLSVLTQHNGQNLG